jgi:hypothetical protein
MAESKMSMFHPNPNPKSTYRPPATPRF